MTEKHTESSGLATSCIFMGQTQRSFTLIYKDLTECSHGLSLACAVEKEFFLSSSSYTMNLTKLVPHPYDLI